MSMKNFPSGLDQPQMEVKERGTCSCASTGISGEEDLSKNNISSVS